MNIRELEVLNIVCAAGKPVTSTEIVESKKGLNQSTVIAVLRKLVVQEMVSVSGVAYSGKVLARQYVPTPKAKEAVAAYYLKEFARTKDILSAEELAELAGRFRRIMTKS